MTELKLELSNLFLVLRLPSETKNYSVSSVYKKTKKLHPYIPFSPAYYMGSLGHRTGKTSPYWFERLCVKRAWDDNFAR